MNTIRFLVHPSPHDRTRRRSPPPDAARPDGLVLEARERMRSMTICWRVWSKTKA
nr:hypothetical protein [uncultured Brevundimonas sp.]